jgi:hypothetical protein
MTDVRCAVTYASSVLTEYQPGTTKYAAITMKPRSATIPMTRGSFDTGGLGAAGGDAGVGFGVLICGPPG